MSRTITLAQLQMKTEHELISDQRALCMDALLGPVTVRRAERNRERRYPLHGQLRRASVRYFLEQGWDVVPHGVGVWGANGVLADLAITKGRRIVLVECLTPSWVTRENAAKKRRLEKFFPVWFVIEHPAVSGDGMYRRRAEGLAARSRVFVWSNNRSLTSRWNGRAASAASNQLRLASARRSPRR